MKRIFQNIHFSRKNLPHYAMMLFAFAVPLHKKAIVPLGFVLLLILLYNFRFTEFQNRFKQNKLLLLSIAYYAIFVLGLLWTENMSEGIFDLEVKLSFLAFPLIFYLYPVQQDKKHHEFILKSFVAGTFVGMLICLVQATFAFIKLPVVYYTFLYSHLSVLHHPTYFAMFLNLSLVILLVWQRQQRIANIPAILLSVVIIFFNWLLMSRSGIVTTIFILFLYWISLFFEKKFKGAVIILLILITGGLIAVNTSKYTMRRINTMGNFFRELAGKKQEGKTTATDSRFITWSAAIDYIKTKPLMGAGTGDVHDALDDYYRKHHLETALDKSLNAHNQFLQTWVAVGIGGLLLLLAMFTAGLICSRKNRDLIGAGFFVICFLTMLIESTLETQSGVVFFSFFYALFITYRSKEE
jgi:O-antigen ligase